MEKRLRATPRLPFYVFTQKFACEDWEGVQENICDIVEAVKEPSWYEFWFTQGNEITLDAWKVKYKDFIGETSCEAGDEEVHQVHECDGKLSTNQSDVDQNSSIEQQNTIETSLIWQELWDEHANIIYADQYKAFQDIYENYYWNLKEALEETNKSKKFETEDIAEIEDDLELLKLAGLPTAFGKRNYTSPRQNNVKTKPIEQIDYLESSDSEDFSSEYSDEYESEIEMPPFKKANPNNTEDETGTGSDKNLHKIINKNFVKAKTRLLLDNAPQFMLKENSMLKYWQKRFTLFSLFDKGVKLDRESWFSVTPEKVAEHMAKRMACDIIIDGFCGCGGNTIQFAKTCKRVIAIDIDPNKIEMARHNAGIYGVADKIDFIVGDFLQLCENGRIQGDVVFLSPPWGGPTYTKLFEYDIETKLQPVGASKLTTLARNISKNIALFLPRNSNIKQIIQLAGLGNKCEVEHNYLGKRLIGLTAFYGQHFKEEV